MTKNIKEMIEKYDDSAVSTVEALEHIRLKPSMYLGSTATPYHALIEIINNSVDEAVIGVADKIDVIIHKDGSLSVEDNGRGLPVNYSTKFKGITSRALLTKTNTGKAFGSGGSSGTSQNGVGGKANLATSDWLKMEVYRDGYKYSDSFATIDGKPGIPTTDLVKNELPKVKLPKEDKEKHGTKLHWLPSIDVWDSINIDTEELKEFLHQMAYLNPGLELNLIIEKSKRNFSWKETGGIESLVQNTISKSGEELLTPIYNIRSSILAEGKVEKEIKADISFAWTNSETSKIVLFTNQVSNPDLGTPATGFKFGIAKAINNKAKELKLAKDTIEQRDILPGLIAVLSITMPDPKFSGQTKREITSAEAKPAINNITVSETDAQFDRTADKIKAVIKLALQRSEERKRLAAARINLNSKEIQRKISEKLSPSRYNGLDSELWLVEGDSAGGTMKMQRYVDWQAILPLRGKVINTLKNSAEKVRQNVELTTLFAALGCGIGEDYDESKLQYGKLIIANDSDSDGFAISNLIITALLTFTPDLIRNGHVYRIDTPLFVNTLKNGKKVYSYNDKDQEEFLKKNKNNITKISRNKGLGELSAQLVKETMVSPDTRRLRRLIMNEENESAVFENSEIFMGKDTGLRRDIIISEIDFVDESE